jgi:hypothetical protein
MKNLLENFADYSLNVGFGIFILMAFIWAGNWLFFEPNYDYYMILDKNVIIIEDDHGIETTIDPDNLEEFIEKDNL